MTDRQITERMIYEANIRVAKAQLWNEAAALEAETLRERQD